VYLSLATEELAAVGAFFADDFRALGQLRIADQQRAAFAGNDVLGFVEGIGAHVADGAQRLALVGRHDAWPPSITIRLWRWAMSMMVSISQATPA
jgi:hypothetical protein